MREDIYEPLSRYRDEFREKFSRLAAEKFEAMTSASRVDTAANKILAGNIRKLEAERSRVEGYRTLWQILNFFLILLGIGGVVTVIFALMTEDPRWLACRPQLLGGGITAAAAGFWLFFQWSLPACRNVEKKIAQLTEKIDAKIREAWEQMAPLNALFDWSITAELIEKTVPRLQFDPFFTEARLRDLQTSYGWDESFMQDKSVIHVHSGVINDNPFALVEMRRQEWGTKTYTGYLEISWTEQVRDSEGKTRTVRRYQTLTAHVEKPIPVYMNDKVLIYGSEAAPELDFSRKPSDLSGEKGGLWNTIKRSHRLSKLKKQARNLDDDSDFTMMSNEEFELLFHANDRSDEIAFRLLFTPLAQQQMVALLNDRDIGFGDDFHFIKEDKINMIFAQHLYDVSFSHDPEQFKGYDFESVKAYFLRYNNAFFKAAYFAFAPLLVIPLYQQTRTRQAIYGEKEQQISSGWEHEALANYYGDGVFEHPSCVTQNILKTKCLNRHGNRAEIEVTASGFRGDDRLEFVSVYGGDGRWHSVPVEWVEYLPVEKTSRFEITDLPEETQIDPLREQALLRRSIYSHLGLS